MLFKNTDAADFKIESLFENKALATGLIHIPEPACLSLKPSELYTRIKHIAKVRYGYELPESYTGMATMKNFFNKLALLRDLCRKLGIHVSNKDYVLENEMHLIQPRIQAQHAATAEASVSGRKKTKVAQLSDD